MMYFMGIEWKEVNPDYIVSSNGQVASRKFGKLKVLKPLVYGVGYVGVVIRWGGITKARKIHTLVAEAFLGPRPTPKHQVNHKNGLRADNRVENLEWVTQGENNRHRFKVLQHYGDNRGAEVWTSKLTEAQVREVRERVKAGESQRRIAKDMGVTQANISCIATGKSWAWMT